MTLLILLIGGSESCDWWKLLEFVYIPFALSLILVVYIYLMDFYIQTILRKAFQVHWAEELCMHMPENVYIETLQMSTV